MKQNAFLAKMQYKQQLEVAAAREFAISYLEDCAIIAANKYFGAGEKRAWEFKQVLHDVMMDLATMTVDDSKDDPKIEFTKERTDRALKQILGKHFEPWEVRHGGGKI